MEQHQQKKSVAVKLIDVCKGLGTACLFYSNPCVAVIPACALVWLTVH